MTHDAQVPDADLANVLHLDPTPIAPILNNVQSRNAPVPIAELENFVVVVPNTCSPNDACIETVFTTDFHDNNPQTINEAAQISSLPNEILADIFELVFFFPQAKRPELPPEIILSQIVRRWRNVALTTPLIWTKIYVGFRRSLAVSKAYFRRSGSLPIHLQIDICQLHLCDAQFGIRSLSKLAVDGINRWQRLHIRYDSTTDFSTFLQRLHSVYAPRLEYIQIDSADRHLHHMGNFPHNIMVYGAPALRFVRLRGLGLYSCLPPLASVTFLELDHIPADLQMTYGQIKDMFDNLPSLTQLVIRGSAFALGWQTSSHMIINLHSLRLLSISNAYGQDTGEFLRILSAPLLEFMALEGNVEGILFAWNPAPNQKQCPSLLSLAISGSTSMSENLAMTKLSYAFPAITHLAISYQTIRPFAWFLEKRDVNTGLPYWPNLETISMSRISFFWGEPELFSDALSARMRMGSRIKRMVFSKDVWSEARLHSRDSVARTFLGIKMEQSQTENVHLASLDRWDDEFY